ncbi:Trp biosynthesis-associated membrane protein [Cryobacterium sp. PH29-G1]|uniref:Trp biosynthesis-associated membrane protein n=1 Tax=Cryobacterium sp. PH29-G1 TaxID=3046211 RepID=UPI0024BA711B|nr:Trp biosynthesis-associated membrane protein [Cryobacterium sp. PH29-G1]MDJ0350857.1 Trp biosynthesis-associated membrane protein [Cryobacterium sp. PH29-G1]
MSPRRLKLALILTILAASGLALLAWTQVWVHAEVGLPDAGTQVLQIDGAIAAPALTALALSGFALAGALTIAGRLIRIVLGALEVLLGFSVFLAAFLAVDDPSQASAAAVTAATGIAGHESIQLSVLGTIVTPWPFVAMAAAIAMAAVGVAVILTSARWPGPTRKYQAVRFEPVAASNGSVPASLPADAAPAGPTAPAPNDSVGDWDDLSRGEDPTAR